MPYIKHERRIEIDAGATPFNVGELTYQLYNACVQYMRTFKTPRYEDYADVSAALENAKLEFYRMHTSHYEDEKRNQNGEII